MAFLGQTEAKDRRFPRVRLLVLIKDDKYMGWENLMTLKVIRLYLNKMWNVIGNQFLKKRRDMACSIKSKHNSVKGLSVCVIVIYLWTNEIL